MISGVSTVFTFENNDVLELGIVIFFRKIKLDVL